MITIQLMLFETILTGEQLVLQRLQEMSSGPEPWPSDCVGFLASCLISTNWSTFKTTSHKRLFKKLSEKQLRCMYFLFLAGWSQPVNAGSFILNPITFNTRAPAGCVLSLLQYSLYTFD
ncbi:hypothetical protein ILYODFUR_023123 [Ilyodon furcidens]|uniref:Uncharacterized protein n=1 Tax=Ilyodon furcidens TaxID=33524 RepID=A0ABV0UIZ4_9TELE